MLSLPVYTPVALGYGQQKRTANYCVNCINEQTSSYEFLCFVNLAAVCALTCHPVLTRTPQ